MPSMLMWCNAQPKYKVCVVFAEGQRRWQDPHHLRFAQPRALDLKVSDEFTVPLCRDHHRQLHQAGNEVAWWHNVNIKPLEIARTLWEKSRPKSVLQNDAPQIDADVSNIEVERRGSTNKT